ncbi:hypothetical protein SPBRAN_379 [uncultured Candidatus Thioglobus sp.]|nr:hypothetical protein SPBRAN_379 [uncultured Candidatus Thioglobus sp.]
MLLVVELLIFLFSYMKEKVKNERRFCIQACQKKLVQHSLEKGNFT